MAIPLIMFWATLLVALLITLALIIAHLLSLWKTAGPTERPNPIFYLEGNIGAGKSTLATGLAASGKYRVQKEPVAEWQNVYGYNLLALLGQDRQRWTFAFQTLVLATLTKRVRQTEKPFAGKPCILERSTQCAMEVFARNGHQEGFLSNEEMAVLRLLHETMGTNEGVVYIYVRTPPEESFRRAALRGRAEERQLPADYFMRLHALMDQWLLHNEAAPVIVVNGLLPPADLLREVIREVDRHLENRQ